MLKNDLLDLINKFEKETWKYTDSEELDEDMDFLYSLANFIKKTDNIDLKDIYEKLTAIIGIMRLKYGNESIIINDIEDLRYLKKYISEIKLDNKDIVSQYDYASSSYKRYISRTKDVSFIKNKYENVAGKEGLYLAIESLKSLISNNRYRELLDEKMINEIIIDCVCLNNGTKDLINIESKYKDLINRIWDKSLTNRIDGNNFKVLFSNISGDNLKDQANRLNNRVGQSSCSLITSDFMAIYGSITRKIGFIYPSNSEIIMASAYDLGSNVFGMGMANADKGTTLVTPEVMEQIGIKRARESNQDNYSSNCYNEVLVNTKPCGLLVVGFGEKDLNIYLEDAISLANEMNIPIQFIDLMDYKTTLSDNDKYYIAFHSLMSYFNISPDDIIDQNNDYSNLSKLINLYKEPITNIFLSLKSSGNLSKETMCEMIDEQLDLKDVLETGIRK